MTGRRSIECELFQKRYADLNSAIKDPDVFSRHLISKGFVTDQVATNMLTPTGISEYAKVGKFLSTVSSQLTIIKNPDALKEKFYAFLRILQEFDEDLGREISREYGKSVCMENCPVSQATPLNLKKRGLVTFLATEFCCIKIASRLHNMKQYQTVIARVMFLYHSKGGQCRPEG